jgi:hypothetical protein
VSLFDVGIRALNALLDGRCEASWGAALGVAVSHPHSAIEGGDSNFAGRARPIIASTLANFEVYMGSLPVDADIRTAVRSAIGAANGLVVLAEYMLFEQGYDFIMAPALASAKSFLNNLRSRGKLHGVRRIAIAHFVLDIFACFARLPLPV